MSFENRWDCPIPLREILMHYALLALLSAVAGAMMGAGRQLFRGLGWMAAVALLFWAVCYTIAVGRWGITRASDVPLDLWSRRMSAFALIGPDALLLLIVISVSRWRMRIRMKRQA
ncbi:MAG TPA: hypothetical protein VNA69_03140 [Thermoanaerobaculia bacterium]|nr:hypothetical protein [Thermoanaerobaculia bacterium]